jgi:primosomal protein N' (replication factor Y)
MQNKLKIAQVVPFQRLPRRLDFFDYLIPANLSKVIKVGHLIEAPFKNKKILGIVFAIKNKSQINNLKPLINIKQTIPYLAAAQIDLAKWFAKYYHYSLASTLKIMAPPVPKRMLELPKQGVNIGAKAVILSKPIQTTAHQILASKTRKFLLLAYEPKLKAQLIASLARALVKKKKQLLIITASKIKLQALLAALPKDLQDHIAVVTAEMSAAKNRAYQIWHEIRNNQKQIIIGTRSAIFTSIPHLELIFVDDAHCQDLKSWDQLPHYHTIDVVKKIQALTNCSLILSSFAPRLVDYYQAQQEQYKLIKLGNKLPINKVKVINLREARLKEFTYLSDSLINAIKQKVTNQKKVLLIVNKKGYASYLMCQDCDYVPTCEICQFAFTVNNKQLECFHCHQQQAMPLHCTKCHGTNLVGLGIGLDQVLDLIKQAFPEQKVSDDLNQNADIYITTAHCQPTKHWLQIDLIGFVYIDSLMYFPDFSTNEKIYQLILNLIDQYQAYCNKSPEVLIQTCFVNNNAISHVTKPFHDFYQAEIKGREQFNYPPFKQFLKLYFQHHDQNICSKQARSLSQQLKLKYKNSKIEISEPYFYYRQQIRGRYRSQILLKIDKNQPLMEDRIMADLPDYWRIDKDPISVL